MKYNLRKHSVHTLRLTDDRGQKALSYENWRKAFVSGVEAGDMNSLSAFVKQNKEQPGFDYFLMSMIPFVQSVYDDEAYESVIDLIKNSSPNVRERINE